MKKLLLLTASLLSVAAVLTILNNSVSHEFENDKNENQDAAGYAHWLNQIRMNPATGMINYNDVLNAREEAKLISGNRSALGLTWEEMGPDNVGGRTRAILFDKFINGVVITGGVAGGIWRSVNGGSSWTAVNDHMESLEVNSVCQAANGDIYIGTGEGDYGNYGTASGGFPGEGIFKSTDHGLSFVQLASTKPTNSNSTSDPFCHINRLAADRTDGNKIIAACEGGIYHSEDAGVTWNKYIISGLAGIGHQVVISSNNTYFAIQGTKMARSTDGGVTWTAITSTNGLPSGNNQNVEMGVCESDPNYVFMGYTDSQSAFNGLYKSVDGGQNFSLISGSLSNSTFNPTGNQGWYDFGVTVSPTNRDLVYICGQLSIWHYSPSWGFESVTSASQFNYNIYVHADHHTMTWNPFNPNEMMIGCDGGIYKSLNANTRFPNFSSSNINYAVTQAYAVGAGKDGTVLFGNQDNGGQYIDFTGNTTHSAKRVYGGDGGMSEISLINPQAMFGETQNGNLLRSADGGNGGFNNYLDAIVDADQDGAPDAGANWITPFKLWENDPTAPLLIIGAANGDVWVTPDPLNFGIEPPFFKLQEASGTATTIAMSRDGNHLFVGFDNGNVYRYDNIKSVYDAGKFHYSVPSPTAASWSAADSGITVAHVTVSTNAYITGIAIDPYDNDKIVVTTGGYGLSNNVWQSTNATTAITLTSIQGNLPHMPCYSAVIDEANTDNIILGTELGIYATNTNGADWTEENNGLAIVPVFMLRQIPYQWSAGSVIYAATHGRGIFKTSSLITGINQQNENHIINSVDVFPNPASDKTTLHISLSKSESVEITVYDYSGRVVKTLNLSNQPKGNLNLPLNVSDLATGNYILNITAGTSKMKSKLMVVHY